MPGKPIHVEDFFQRIIGVHWESEPEVYWMAGDGDPTIVNGIIAGSQSASVLTSKDGMYWNVTSVGGGGGAIGFGAIYSGGWMRVGRQEKAPPVWVFVGGSSKFTTQSATAYSTDGKQTSAVATYDDRHFMDQFGAGGPGLVQCKSIASFDGHSDTHTSADGKTWQPPRFHPPDPELFAAHSLSAAAVSIEPFAIASTAGDKKTLIPSGHRASGRVQEGRFRGDTISVAIEPFDSNRPAHGGPMVRVTNPSSKESVLVNTGIDRTVCCGYGHYTFCVGGSVKGGAGGGGSGGSTGCIAWSDDGLKWNKQVFSGLDQINMFAVGPRE